ncbi:hypothetical protein YC2023_046189 [Brassica napus]
MAISTVEIHIIGNVPSSPLFSVVQVVNNPSSFSSPILEESKTKMLHCCYTQDHINSWRKTALIFTSVLFLVAAIWFMEWTSSIRMD